MHSRVCTKCGLTKRVSQFNWKNEKKGWRHGFCKSCHAAYRKIHYLRNRKKYIDKASVWNQKQTKALRTFILCYLTTHPCVDCGEKDIRVLDFDHEGKKLMGIAQMIRNCHSVDSIKREMAKCRVRCANCHRIKTFVRGNYWKEKMGP